MAQSKVLFRGRWACQCVVDSVLEYERVTGGYLKPGEIYQGGYNRGGVSASAGTHDGGGVLDTVSFSNARIKAASAIGLWPNNRTRAQGFTPHNHMLVFGCPHAPAGLAWQESELRRGRSGLARRGVDPHRGLRPEKVLTWKQYKAKRNAKATANKKVVIMGKSYAAISKVTAYWVNANRAVNGRTVSRHVYWVQTWLARLGYYRGPRDGHFGKVTQTALDSYRSRAMKLKGSEAKGPIGLGSLSHLARAAKTTLGVAK